MKKERIEKFLNHKDSEVRAFAEEVAKVYESPAFQTLISISLTSNIWNEQIQNNKVNLFDPEDKDKFDMVFKFMKESKPMIEFHAFLVDKLQPKEVEEAKKAVSLLEIALQESGELDEGLSLKFTT